MKWQLLSVLMSTALLGGCSSNSGDLSALLEAGEHYWRGDADRVSLQQAAAIPYATLGIRVDRGPEQILVLATDNGGVRLWTSPTHVSITIRDGRIIRTSGFGTDLSGDLPRTQSAQSWLTISNYDWLGDFSDIGYYSVAVNCHIAQRDRDPIEILGKQFDTMRLIEKCSSSELDWTFENTYWVSPNTGRVWRSIQKFHPRGPEVELEYLRPPEGSN